MIRRSLVVVAVAVLVMSCATKPATREDAKMPSPQYKGEVGESPVGVIPDAVIHDAKRGKDVTITIEYPTRSAANPLILFSPGYGGTSSAYVGLSSYWASQGFVVIRVAHADAGKQIAENTDFWQTQTESDRRNRVGDLTFVLDSLDSLEADYPELKGKIDHAKIALAGHSYGAYTVLLAAGMKTFPGGTSYADPRVKAVVAMSPQGPGELRGLTNESFASIKVPALFMTGSRDRGFAESETPEWRSQAFELASPGDKWLIIVENARSASFIGRNGALIEAQAREPRDPTLQTPPPGGFDPRNPNRDPRDPSDPTNPQRRSGSYAGNSAMRDRDLFGTIKAMSLAFVDAYLKADSKGREALENALTAGGVVVKKK